MTVNWSVDIKSKIKSDRQLECGYQIQDNEWAPYGDHKERGPIYRLHILLYTAGPVGLKQKWGP